jgi:TRAP transporter TAXI family solute receptor
MNRTLGVLVRHWRISTVVLLLACLALGFLLAAPAPPREIRIAVSTAADSAYSQAAEAYATRLEETGFRVARVATAGSVENLELLRARRIDVALVQGGIADRQRDAGLESLGAVFHEPVWVFLRTDRGLARVHDIIGRRVAVGPEGSGNRVLAMALLAANDIAPGAVTALPLGGPEAAQALLAGEIEAAVFVSNRAGAAIQQLMRAGPLVRALDFAEHAEAYGARLPFLDTVRVPRGGLSLAGDLPDAPLTLLAPVASVVMQEDTHPQVVSLLVGIMQEVHRPRSLFAAEGSFPNMLAQDLPMNADAQRYFSRGRTVLQSWLPFWVAVWVERLLFILLPVIGIALPIIRFGPMLYAWQVEGRIWRHYETLRRIESEAARAADLTALEALSARLRALEDRVSHQGVPSAYRRHVFALRRDIAYVRDHLDAGRKPAPAPADPDED